jgi:phosphoglycolate phosphatase-like HAD superfamily hydrolase
MTSPLTAVSTVRGVVFDLDGTLIDSNALHVMAWVGGLAEHNIIAPADAVRPLIGMGGDRLPSVLVGDMEERLGDNIRIAVGGALRALAASSRVHVFSGAMSLLAALRARGVRLALATSASQDDLDALMGSVVRGGGEDMRRHFDAVITKSDVESSKPAPDVISVACERLGVPAASCLMVGDTEYDMEAAERAGVPAVAVLTSGLAPHAELRERLLAAGARALWSGTEAMAAAVGGAAGSADRLLDGDARMAAPSTPPPSAYI